MTPIFVINSSDLAKALGPHKGVIVKNPTVPILENYYMNIADQVLTVTSSDLNITLQTKISVDNSASQSLTIPAAKLDAVLSNLPAQPISFFYDASCFATTIKSASGATFQLTGENPKDFPLPKIKIDGENQISILAKELADALAKTEPFTSSEPLRPALGGVYFESLGSDLRIVATDRFRLSTYRITDVEVQGIDSFIIPKRAAKMMSKASSGLANLKIGATQFLFVCEQFNLVGQLVDERYAPWQGVVPVDNPVVLLIQKAELTAALKRVSALASPDTASTAITFEKNQIVLYCENMEYGQYATDCIAVDYDGPELRIGVNANLLLSLLSVADAEITIRASKPNMAMILESSAAEFSLIMPIYLKKP